MAFTFTARGHPAILSSHPTTLEITRESHVTSKGDCIVAVGSECGIADIPASIKQELSSEKRRGKLTLSVGNFEFAVEGKGNKGLTFTNQREIVVRRSGFISDRTLMVYATRAAINVPRKMVKLLQDPSKVVTVGISVI